MKRKKKKGEVMITNEFEEDKNADYCTCEPHFEMPNTSLCSMCHKPLK